MPVTTLATKRVNSRLSRVVQYCLAIMTEARADMKKVIAAIQVYKPYKPRRLKQDNYHSLMRKARKTRPKNALRDAKSKRTRQRWEKKNRLQLRRRAEIVREKRKGLGLD